MDKESSPQVSGCLFYGGLIFLALLFAAGGIAGLSRPALTAKLLGAGLLAVSGFLANWMRAASKPGAEERRSIPTNIVMVCACLCLWGGIGLLGKAANGALYGAGDAEGLIEDFEVGVFCLGFSIWLFSVVKKRKNKKNRHD